MILVPRAGDVEASGAGRERNPREQRTRTQHGDGRGRHGCRACQRRAVALGDDMAARAGHDAIGRRLAPTVQRRR
ncbi:hypothetical protein BE21_12165 [Sorangium cellulosum]|uniref:Uncharacterized protein n=2 Tax=Sorangium cellulosum TaxID=56 RepID=A0A150U0B7_SORCE|nr:hypothetical protein SCE1572_40575 [Sorangium cellulosum So0157-2]KYG10402.1 hypothetical protein BE21_12165 [Sorangium cellulosum]